MKKVTIFLCAGLFSPAVCGLEIKLQQYGPEKYAAASVEDVLTLSDTPGYRIEDAVANGFTVTRVAALTAEANEAGKTGLETFMSAISSRAAEAGANAVYINAANAYPGSNSIAQVKGDLYRVVWAGEVPENLQAGFGAAARLFNTELITRMPYYAKRQALMFGVERSVINDIFGLQLSTAASPLEQFSDMTCGELTRKQSKRLKSFFKLQAAPSDDTVVNDILVAGSIESLDVFLGSIKSGLKKEAQLLMAANPAEYASYRDIYFRIYGALPVEDPQADPDSE